MKNPVGRTIFLLVSLTAFGQRPPEPRVRYAALPHYPPIARLAKIQGEVKVEFLLNTNGEPISVVAISGHPMLKGSAEDNVKSWRFELSTGSGRTDRKYETVFNFKIVNDNQPYNQPYEDPKLTVTMDSYRYVEVTTNPPSTKYAHDCPLPDETQPPQSITAGDFVELSRSGCYGTCPSYKVRVAENGDVTWSGGTFVEARGDVHATVSSEAARSLLEEFRSPRFWALCGGYDASVTDNPTMQIEVRFGSRSKTVWNYADSAPEFESALEDSVDAAANTHAWRHGDPKTEWLSNIGQDAYMPKPGVSLLMRAAAKGDVGAMKELLRSGAEVDATDSSGWTALMYAAASSHSEPVQVLLAAGANPNHRSFNGDTPLMASAISQLFDEDLAHAGADVNAKNSAGTTALMILAAGGETDEVKDALKSGADVTLKDAKGRTALDYLRLGNCGSSPIPKYSTFTIGESCNHLDKEDVREVTLLLKTAMHSR